MSQLQNIEAIEKRLWEAADTLRANSNHASNEYFLPVMGLVFLRHAYSRYLLVKDKIIANLPTRGGKTPELTKKDFARESAIFLQPKAQFDFLVKLEEDKDLAAAVIEAMDSIEQDYETLRGVLPKEEYRKLDNNILGQLLLTLNPEELKKVTGDVFGRIYEYFLTRFAGSDAPHNGGEFFTPVSLVSMIANVLEPRMGTVLDPACGSGGMFVQSARFLENLHENPMERLTFYGLEKNETTINLAKMNLAVHGLEGDIKRAITYHEDPHDLCGKADFVMANPPFNVDKIDADKIKNDPRLPFGLPGVNKKGNVGNGNYIWISFFYSYLSPQGRAGFVMSSQASSAGGVEAKVREKLIKTGHVEMMISIRSNFFYTRTVPCELWFFNKAKPEALKDKVLMIDARNIFRKVTRKIYDFSPEQLQNILSIVWLYRGEAQRFHDLVVGYISTTLDEALGSISFAREYETLLDRLYKEVQPFLGTLSKQDKLVETLNELDECVKAFNHSIQLFEPLVHEHRSWWEKQPKDTVNLAHALNRLEALTGENNKLIKEAESMFRLVTRLIDQCLNTHDAKQSDTWNTREIANLRKQAEEARNTAVDGLKSTRYFHHQALWLVERFPDEKLRDVEGLVKLVDKAELEENDWSLTPGRYVGVAPEEEDPDFDFAEVMCTIHSELEALNVQAAELATRIDENFKRLGL